MLWDGAVSQPYKTKNNYSLICRFGCFLLSQLLICAGLTSRAFWLVLPANFDSRLAWHSLKPGIVSSDFWGRWLHPGFLTLTADAFRNMLQSTMTLFRGFFPLELTNFGFGVFFPIKETPAQSGLGHNVKGNTLYFLLSLLWSKTFSGALGWPSFSLPSLNKVVGQRQLSSVVLCSAVPWVTNEVTDTAASPYVHRPFEVTSKGLFAKGLQVQGS